MRAITRFLILSGIGVFLFQACGTKKKLTSADTEMSMEEEIETIYSDYLVGDFSTFRMKGQIRIDQWPRAGYDIRIVRDSAIWFSAKIVGFELCRGIFTKDRVQVMDKWSSDYFDGNYTDFQYYSEVPLTYSLIQDLLLNRPVPEGFRISKIDESKSSLDFEATDGLYDMNMNDREPLVSPDVYNYTSSVSDYDLKVLCSDYKKFTNDIIFPYIREYIVLEDEKSDMTIEIKTQKIEKNTSFKIPYQVPSSYKRMAMGR